MYQIYRLRQKTMRSALSSSAIGSAPLSPLPPIRDLSKRASSPSRRPLGRPESSPRSARHHTVIKAQSACQLSPQKELSEQGKAALFHKPEVLPSKVPITPALVQAPLQHYQKAVLVETKEIPKPACQNCEKLQLQVKTFLEERASLQTALSASRFEAQSLTEQLRRESQGKGALQVEYSQLLLSYSSSQRALQQAQESLHALEEQLDREHTIQTTLSAERALLRQQVTSCEQQMASMELSVHQRDAELAQTVTMKEASLSESNAEREKELDTLRRQFTTQLGTLQEEFLKMVSDRNLLQHQHLTLQSHLQQVTSEMNFLSEFKAQTESQKVTLEREQDTVRKERQLLEQRALELSQKEERIQMEIASFEAEKKALASRQQENAEGSPRGSNNKPQLKKQRLCHLEKIKPSPDATVVQSSPLPVANAPQTMVQPDITAHEPSPIATSKRTPAVEGKRAPVLVRQSPLTVSYSSKPSPIFEYKSAPVENKPAMIVEHKPAPVVVLERAVLKAHPTECQTLTKEKMKPQIRGQTLKDESLPTLTDHSSRASVLCRSPLKRRRPEWSSSIVKTAEDDLARRREERQRLRELRRLELAGLSAE